MQATATKVPGGDTKVLNTTVICKMNSYQGAIMDWNLLGSYIVGGGTVNYLINVSNLGNIEERFDLIHLPLQDGWSIHYYDIALAPYTPLLSLGGNPYFPDISLPPSVTGQFIGRWIRMEVNATAALNRYDLQDCTLTLRPASSYNNPNAAEEDEDSLNITTTFAKVGASISDTNANNKYCANAKHHNVNPGKMTSYVIDVFNGVTSCGDVWLDIGALTSGWSASLAYRDQSCDPLKVPSSDIPSLGDRQKVYVNLTSPSDADEGEWCNFTVTVKYNSNSSSEDISFSARATANTKVYIIAIDALSQEYLNLNSTGLGAYDPSSPTSDALMPHIWDDIRNGSYYKNCSDVLVAATDVNHEAIITGLNSGDEGMFAVSDAYSGLDADGHATFVKYTHDDLRNMAGHVNTIYNSATDKDPYLKCAVLSNKNWIADIQADDDICTKAHGRAHPFYCEPPKKYYIGDQYAEGTTMPDSLRERMYWRYNKDFASDRWLGETAAEMIEREDPDVFYILLANMDDAQHLFGTAWNTSEFNANGENTINPVWTNRNIILSVAKNADAQIGNITGLLNRRGTLENSTVIITADHGQNTMEPALDNIDILQTLETEGFTEGKLSLGNDFEFIYTACGVAGILGINENSRQSIKEKLTTALGSDLQTIYDGEELRNLGVYSEYFKTNHIDGENQVWPDMLIFLTKHKQFKIYPELAKAGANNLGFSVPWWPQNGFGCLIGGHGEPDEMHVPLVVFGKNILENYAFDRVVTLKDVAPTICKLNNWTIPNLTDGYPLECLGTLVYYRDSRYATSWIYNIDALTAKLNESGFVPLNADQLASWMNKSMAQGFSNRITVVMTHGVAPVTVYEESAPYKIRTFLDKGGSVIWLGDIPFFYRGYSDGTATTVGGEGLYDVLEVAGGQWGEQGVTITLEGKKRGIISTVNSFRMVEISSITTALTEIQDWPDFAGSWFKNFKSSEPTTGFTHYCDNNFDGTQVNDCFSLIQLAKYPRRSKVALYDSNYPVSWVSNADKIRDFFKVRGYDVVSASTAHDWMLNKNEADMAWNSEIVLTTDIVPDTIADMESNPCIIRQYLDIGGKVGWMGDIPFYYQGHSGGSIDVWGYDGISTILDVDVAFNDVPSTITTLGYLTACLSRTRLGVRQLQGILMRFLVTMQWDTRARGIRFTIRHMKRRFFLECEKISSMEVTTPKCSTLLE